MVSHLKLIILKTGKYQDLFDTNNLICGKESGADNFAMSYYKKWYDWSYPIPNTRQMNANNLLFDSVVENLRLLSENCSSLQGFLITHSIGGGAGSGFTSRLMENIAAEYGNGKSKSRIQNSLILDCHND